MHAELNIDLTALIDNLPGMAFRCSNDADLTIEYASRGSVAILGYEPSELIRNKAFRKIVHKNDQHRNKNVLERLSIWSPKYRLIYRIRTANGEDKWVHYTALSFPAQRMNRDWAHIIKLHNKK